MRPASTGTLGDPDGDGQTNAQELLAGTHPRGFAQRYLAEGATSIFFETRISVLNPSPTFTSRVQLRYQLDDGTVRTDRVTLAPRSRRTMIPPAGAAVLDAAGLGSARRRRSHDDLGPERRPLWQPRRVVSRRPRAQLVLRRRRDPRPLRPVLPGAEPERPGRRGRRPLPARSGRRRRARDPPLHGRRAPAPDDQRRLHSRASRPPTSPASSTARTERRSSSSGRCTGAAAASCGRPASTAPASPRSAPAGSWPKAPPGRSSTRSCRSPTRRRRWRGST